MRPALVRALSIQCVSIPDLLVEFVSALGFAPSVELSEQNELSNFMELSKAILDTHKKEHAAYLDVRDLRRPSRWTLLWPRVVLLPPLTLYCVKMAYASRATLTDLTMDALETAHNFVTDWLLEHICGVFRTIRAGGEEGVIVRPEAVSADMDVRCPLPPWFISHLTVFSDSLSSEWRSRSPKIGWVITKHNFPRCRTRYEWETLRPSSRFTKATSNGPSSLSSQALCQGHCSYKCKKQRLVQY